jgi:hypothetical protein
MSIMWSSILSCKEGPQGPREWTSINDILTSAKGTALNWLLRRPFLSLLLPLMMFLLMLLILFLVLMTSHSQLMTFLTPLITFQTPLMTSRLQWMTFFVHPSASINDVFVHPLPPSFYSWSSSNDPSFFFQPGCPLYVVMEVSVSSFVAAWPDQIREATVRP